MVRLYGKHYITEHRTPVVIDVIGKIVKKHPPLCEAQRVQKCVNPETKKIVRLQNCSRRPDHFSESNFKFQMLSNDILSCKNIEKAVTEKNG